MNMKWFIVCGLAVSVLLVIFVSPLASSFPDGLEWAAEKIGFLEHGEGEPTLKSPMPDYECPLVDKEKYPALATILSGLAGMAVVFFVTLGIAHAMKARKKGIGSDRSRPDDARQDDSAREKK
jgi:hypothetical protein